MDLETCSWNGTRLYVGDLLYLPAFMPPCSLLPYWIIHDRGKLFCGNSKVWLLRLVIHDTAASTLLSWIIGSLPLGEASHHIVRELQQPYGEIWVARN